MRAEFERLWPLMHRGGFIPSVDHQTPPNVTLDQYRVYRRLAGRVHGRGGSVDLAGNARLLQRPAPA